MGASRAPLPGSGERVPPRFPHQVVRRAAGPHTLDIGFSSACPLHLRPRRSVFSAHSHQHVSVLLYQVESALRVTSSFDFRRPGNGVSVAFLRVVQLEKPAPLESSARALAEPCPVRSPEHRLWIRIDPEVRKRAWVTAGARRFEVRRTTEGPRDLLKSGIGLQARDKKVPPRSGSDRGGE